MGYLSSTIAKSDDARQLRNLFSSLVKANILVLFSANIVINLVVAITLVLWHHLVDADPDLAESFRLPFDLVLGLDDFLGKTTDQTIRS